MTHQHMHIHTQQCGQRAKVTHHMTNADVGGLEYADVSLHGESGGYADAAVWGRAKVTHVLGLYHMTNVGNNADVVMTHWGGGG